MSLQKAKKSNKKAVLGKKMRVKGEEGQQKNNGGGINTKIINKELKGGLLPKGPEMRGK